MTKQSTLLTDYVRGMRDAVEIVLRFRNQHSDAAYVARERKDANADAEHRLLADGLDVVVDAILNVAQQQEEATRAR